MMRINDAYHYPDEQDDDPIHEQYTSFVTHIFAV